MFGEYQNNDGGRDSFGDLPTNEYVDLQPIKTNYHDCVNINVEHIDPSDFHSEQKVNINNYVSLNYDSK